MNLTELEFSDASFFFYHYQFDDHFDTSKHAVLSSSGGAVAPLQTSGECADCNLLTPHPTDLI